MMNFAALKSYDSEIYESIHDEIYRQKNQIELIASENFTSLQVMLAQGSPLTNKYAEGYPGRRYYGGCQFVDRAETIAIERAKKLFNCRYANVQPHSGSQANQEVFLALLNPGDTFMGMDLACGGHLTHGSKVNLSGKWFKAVFYGVNREDYTIDMNQVLDVALKEKPKLIIAGGSAYPRFIDFKAFREIADKVGAYLMVDMAHFAGLVAGDVFPTPLPHAHVVTTTTHKTLRGPRGGMILSDCEELFKKFDSAVFPGAQGGPLMHVIAAKAIAFKEALQDDFKNYAAQIVRNSKAMANRLMERDIKITTGGTDCHLSLVDLQTLKITGQLASESLETIGITCNKNGIPYDPLPPVQTSGIRIGSPACTTRGFKEQDFSLISDIIADSLIALSNNTFSETVQKKLKEKTEGLCNQYPLYPSLD